MLYMPIKNSDTDSNSLFLLLSQPEGGGGLRGMEVSKHSVARRGLDLAVAFIQ